MAARATVPPPFGPPPKQGIRPVVVTSSAAPPTTGQGTFVTLQPADPSGHIPGDADDGADFWSLGAALMAIVVFRLILGRRPDQLSRGER